MDTDAHGAPHQPRCYLGFSIAWIEGVEINILGAVAGFDVRRPAIKLPGLGRLGLSLMARPIRPETQATGESFGKKEVERPVEIEGQPVRKT